MGWVPGRQSDQLSSWACCLLWGMWTTNEIRSQTLKIGALGKSSKVCSWPCCWWNVCLVFLFDGAFSSGEEKGLLLLLVLCVPDYGEALTGCPLCLERPFYPICRGARSFAFSSGRSIARSLPSYERGSETFSRAHAVSRIKVGWCVRISRDGDAYYCCCWGYLGTKRGPEHMQMLRVSSSRQINQFSLLFSKHFTPSCCLQSLFHDYLDNYIFHVFWLFKPKNNHTWIMHDKAWWQSALQGSR